MKFNFVEFIKKLQDLPADKRKIILWAIIVVIVLVWGVFFITSAANRLKNTNYEDFFKKAEFPNIGEKIDTLNNTINENMGKIQNLPELQDASDELGKNLEDIQIQEDGTIK